MDWSDKNSCIKCDKGGNLLVCSEDGCPIAVHAGCLGCPARFDDLNRFYCPYCLYKKAFAESRKAREHALARKKALLIFMDEKVVGSEKHMGENNTCEDSGHNQSKTSDENVNFQSCGNGRAKSNNNGILDQPFQLDGENISNAEEDSEASAGSKGQDPSVKMHGEKSKRTEEEKQVQEEECKTSAEEQAQEEERETSVEEEKTQEVEHETSVEEEMIQEEQCEMSSASTDKGPLLTLHARAKRGSKRSKLVDTDSDTDLMQSKLIKQHGKKKKTSPLTVTPTRRSSRKSSSALGIGKVVNEDIGSPRRLKKPEKPSAKLASNMFGSPKRKSLLWTEEEEEAIRAGVEKYLKEGNKKLPWKKILDLFSRKFDATRTPGDLKNKWRNMSGR